MYKIFFFLLFFFFNQNLVLAHSNHYNFLKNLNYEIFRNNKLIGNNNFFFKKNKKNELIVKSETFFEVTKLGIKIYSYKSTSIETHINDNLISFTSKSSQNEKKKFCNITRTKDNRYIIKGSSYNGKTPEKFIVGNFWNHDFIKYSKQIKPSSCKVIEQKVNFIGKEILKLNNNSYEALKFDFYSSDKSLSKDKDFKITLWYDKKNLILLKILYKKLGTWEYRLKFYK